jgi:acyl-CoA thioesterase YciA
MTSPPHSEASSDTPKGELALRVYAMPRDTNVHGQIFGGWVLGQMDIGGAICAAEAAGGLRMVTVAVDAMKFYKPIHKGDEVTIYTQVARIGRTSIAVDVETWVRRRHLMRTFKPIKVTEGRFTFVATDENGVPVEVPKAK